MAKASINLQKAQHGNFKHNDRSESVEPEYLLPKNFRGKNEVDRSAEEAQLYVTQLYNKAAEAHKKVKKQKLQAKSFLLEAVVNLNKEHTLKDVEKLVKKLEEETGFTSVQIAIHRDEGHVKNNVPIYNLHAHITFFTLDTKTGMQLYRKQLTAKQKQEHKDLKAFNRARMSKLQDITAKALNMQRGKKGSKAVRQTAKAYREQAKLLEALKAENAKLRAQLKNSGTAKREDYAALEKEVKTLKEKINAKEVTETQLQEQIETLRTLVYSNKTKTVRKANKLVKRKLTYKELAEKQERDNAVAVATAEQEEISQLKEDLRAKDLENAKLKEKIEQKNKILNVLKNAINAWAGFIKSKYNLDILEHTPENIQHTIQSDLENNIDTATNKIKTTL